MVKYSLLTYFWWNDHENWSSGSDVTPIFKKCDKIVQCCFLGLKSKFFKNIILRNLNEVQTTYWNCTVFHKNYAKKSLFTICFLFYSQLIQILLLTYRKASNKRPGRLFFSRGPRGALIRRGALILNPLKIMNQVSFFLVKNDLNGFFFLLNTFFSSLVV